MNPAVRIMIVDDEAPARRRIRDLLADCAAAVPHQVVLEAANGHEAIRGVAETGANLLLMDIHMPEMSGIEVARHLTALDNPPAVIFTTAFDEYAVKAFEVNAIDYLLKPVRAERLLAALQKARSMPPLSLETLQKIGGSESRRFLSITERGRILLVPVSDILFLRAELKYVTIRTREREYLIEESLTHLEEEFAAQMVRIHRNALVARRAVKGFERSGDEEGESHWEVILDGIAERLPVSRRQWPTVKSLIKG
jgi:two-component system, LytTR family, response regulator AlgR